MKRPNIGVQSSAITAAGLAEAASRAGLGFVPAEAPTDTQLVYLRMECLRLAAERRGSVGPTETLSLADCYFNYVRTGVINGEGQTEG